MTPRSTAAPSPRRSRSARRLSYDLVDRALSPYIGVHYQRAFGESADLIRIDGDDPDGVFFVAGAKMLF